MARGRKEDNEQIKEQARVLLLTDTVASVARKLNRPWSTIDSWRKEFEKEDENHGDSFVRLREKRKEKFINDSWKLIDKCNTLIDRKLQKALDRGDEDKTDIGKLTNILGTLYDKQALANKEATTIVDGNVALRKFEDL